MHLLSSVCCGLVQVALTHRLFGVFFPCCESCSLIMFEVVVFPTFLLAVVSNCVLGHCVFVVSHFLLWAAYESPMAMLGVLLIIHEGCL